MDADDRVALWGIPGHLPMPGPGLLIYLPLPPTVGAHTCYFALLFAVRGIWGNPLPRL